MRSKAGLAWLAGSTLIIVALIIGCGGDGVQQPGDGTQPPVGTATLQGTVIAANNTVQSFGGVTVSVPALGRAVSTQLNGGFVVPGLPAGEFAVEVSTPTYPDYDSATVTVELVVNATTTVNIAVLPLDAPEPVGILLDPSEATIDLNGKIMYHSQLVAENNQVIPNMQPSWVVTGGIGAISPQGVFSADQVGVGQVKAFAGSVERTGSVIVVAPQPPQITTFLANPTVLPASGGDVYIATAVADGDGIPVGNVKAEVFAPGDQLTTLGMVVTNPNSALASDDDPACFLDATFGAVFSAPANDNQPTADGIQAPENYSVRVRVTDRSGASSTSTFTDFVVQGIDQPPPSPTM